MSFSLGKKHDKRKIAHRGWRLNHFSIHSRSKEEVIGDKSRQHPTTMSARKFKLNKCKYDKLYWCISQLVRLHVRFFGIFREVHDSSFAFPVCCDDVWLVESDARQRVVYALVWNANRVRLPAENIVQHKKRSPLINFSVLTWGKCSCQQIEARMWRILSRYTSQTSCSVRRSERDQWLATCLRRKS